MGAQPDAAPMWGVPSAGAEEETTERDREWFEAIARFFTRKSPFQEQGNYLKAPLPASILLVKFVSAGC